MRSAWGGAGQIEGGARRGGGAAAGGHWGSGGGRRGWGQHIRSGGGVVRREKKWFFPVLRFGWVWFALAARGGDRSGMGNRIEEGFVGR